MSYLMATPDQYAEMRRLCRQLTEIHVTDEEAVKVVAQVHRNVSQQMKRKGARYWIKNPPKTYFRNYRGSGVSLGGKIGLSHTPSIYTIVHELAHEYHGTIYPLVRKRNNKEAPAHHGPDYLAHLIFLKDMVLRLKVYKKWIDNPVEAIRINPAIAKQKKEKLVEKVGEGFKVKVVPCIQKQMIFYIFDTDDEEKFKWLEDKIQTGKRFMTMDRKQLKIFTTEIDYVGSCMLCEEYPDERYAAAQIERLTDAIAALHRKEEKETEK